MPAQPQLTQVEKDKLEISPDFDFREIAKRPFAELTPNELGMFKWCGVYHQLQSTFFMIRLVAPGGLMTSRQFQRATELAETYAQGVLCITTRQTLQFHWVRQQDIYKIIEGMAEVGVTTKNGCGDVTRNLVSCSQLGVCPHEVGDYARAFILAMANDPEIRDLQRNLPRKHKISVAGCPRACAQTLMNCQGWVPVERPTPDGKGEFGWQFHAGGGLGARPYLAKRVFDWVPQELALPVAQATAEAFHRHGDRRNRAFARLKIIVDRIGAPAFGDIVLGILRERGVTGLEQIVPAESPVPQIQPAYLDGQTVLPENDGTTVSVRIIIPRSEMQTAQSKAIAGWADTYGNGDVMFTNRQNVEIRAVARDDAESLLGEIREAGLHSEGHERLPDAVACVGTTVCRMAAADTTAAYRLILEEFAEDRAFWEQVGTLKLNLTGCPNNCAHAWIGDIGLRGKRIRQPEGGNVDGFDIFVGGKLSEAGKIGVWVGHVPTPEVPDAIRRLLEHYLANRTDHAETFGQFCERVPVESMIDALNGAEE
ncbi:MAG: nitrite/sulfite reductase [Lentisphaerae bacterium]|jgi:sulfite reductase beta subunit-like hemoprotein|nr:nitrite/sulfite reductase [Lentisphaerota bacterium]MBT4822248.1 nitrite/sulfite reductase [Lentisphaerota bacterium]MBT5608663.1 nitrite/sulfite reductase [Lentisphaerota bacterium]MBT7057643.1 nitrite/sulfite reductase [Lentisphaerota bacterium]MBT7840784.1 nitrite/sulfite reductase [Lentisphaerota bacterium]